jgi:hypothetical protein
MSVLSQHEIDKIIKNVEATLAIEGLAPSDKSREWARLFLQGKLTSEEVIEKIKNKHIRKEE